MTQFYLDSFVTCNQATAIIFLFFSLANSLLLFTRSRLSFIFNFTHGFQNFLFRSRVHTCLYYETECVCLAYARYLLFAHWHFSYALHSRWSRESGQGFLFLHTHSHFLSCFVHAYYSRWLDFAVWQVQFNSIRSINGKWNEKQNHTATRDFDRNKNCKQKKYGKINSKEGKKIEKYICL